LMNHVRENDTYRTSKYSGWYPCISVDGFLFIWTSMISCLQVQKEDVKVRALINVMQVQNKKKKCLRMKLIVKKSQVNVCSVKQFPHHARFVVS
jgi:hypothetical protein